MQDCFEYTIKKHDKVTDNPPIGIYVNKVENRNTLTIKTGYYLELLTPETMKLLGSTKCKVTKDKNGEHLPHLEITEVVLVHWNIVNKNYQENLRMLHKFGPSKLFGQLYISPKKIIF